MGQHRTGLIFVDADPELSFLSSVNPEVLRLADLLLKQDFVLLTFPLFLYDRLQHKPIEDGHVRTNSRIHKLQCDLPC